MPRASSAAKARLLLLAVVLVWGTTFALVKNALADCSPLLFNLLRMVLAFAVLCLWNRAAIRAAIRALIRGLKGHTFRIMPRRTLRIGLAAGVFLGLGYQLQTSGLARTTPSKSAFITGMVVVLVPLLSFIPGVRLPSTPAPRLVAVVGALIAFAGLILLTTPAVATTSVLSGIGPGDWLTLGCALAFAAHLLTVGRASGRMNARTLGTVQIGMAALVLAVTLPAGGRPHFHLTLRLVIALLVTSLLATAAAFTIQSWAQQHLSSTQTALLFTLEPVFAWLTSLLLLHEHLGARAMAGAGLILAGILISELLAQSPPLPSASILRDV